MRKKITPVRMPGHGIDESPDLSICATKTRKCSRSLP
jgi:hypothetical protein